MGCIAHGILVKNLAPYGHFPGACTPDPWHHTYQPTVFVFYVDGFGIKYMTPYDADHLLTCIKQHYHVTVDWSGTTYYGLHLEWNYPGKWVDISVPNYV
eukprot:11277964-Ditylum_brightwellii.AAC.1